MRVGLKRKVSLSEMISLFGVQWFQSRWHHPKMSIKVHITIKLRDCAIYSEPL